MGTDIKKIEKNQSNKAAKFLGRRGGLATAKKRGKKYMKSIGRKGASARWAKKIKKQ